MGGSINGYPKMPFWKVCKGKSIYKWMIWGYLHFRKRLYIGFLGLMNHQQLVRASKHSQPRWRGCQEMWRGMICFGLYNLTYIIVHLHMSLYVPWFFKIELVIICAYVYIYIYLERERAVYILCTIMYYIYICVCACVLFEYIYIYIYTRIFWEIVINPVTGIMYVSVYVCKYLYITLHCIALHFMTLQYIHTTYTI